MKKESNLTTCPRDVLVKLFAIFQEKWQQELEQFRVENSLLRAQARVYQELVPEVMIEKCTVPNCSAVCGRFDGSFPVVWNRVFYSGARFLNCLQCSLPFCQAHFDEETVVVVDGDLSYRLCKQCALLEARHKTLII